MLGFDATWWTAFGAIAQALGALATFFAVVAALWTTRSERQIRGRGEAKIVLELQPGASEGRYHILFHLENSGLRDLHWTNIAWRVGWLRFGPAALKYEWALQSIGMSPFVEHVLRPIEDAKEILAIETHKAAVEKRQFGTFFRKLPLIGYAPISAFALVKGRKPIRLRVQKDLRAYLRTGDHPSTYNLTKSEDSAS